MEQKTNDMAQELSESLEHIMDENMAERRKQLYRHKMPTDHSLRALLLAMTKSELDDIRYNLHVTGASSLKKAELAECLVPAILAFAKRWLPTIVDEEYGCFSHLLQKGGLSTELRDDDTRLDYLRGLGLVACGVQDDKMAFCMPDEVQELFKERTSLSGRHVLVTAAGTIEPIDPVRYIGNRSSGKMGYAVALEAARRGAIVSLISGPSALPDPIGVSEVVRIESAKEMRDAVMDRFDSADIVIKAAAVADYHAKNVSEHKIKKDDDTLTLVLEKNPDILMELGKKKRNDQILVGFAAETRNLLEYARHKLEKKNLDLIVANDVTRRGAGFNTDTNIVRFLGRDGSVEELPMMLKSKLAGLLLDRVEEILEKKNHADYKKVHI